MLSVKEYSQIINTAIAGIKYPSSPRGLYEPIEYPLDAGGKRLRPVLALAACDALCGDPRRALSQAMGVEMFHNFTLLHDDLMDHSPVRRGRPTVYVKWDDRTAVLSGDAMLTMASMLMRGGQAHALSQESLIALLNLFDTTAMEIYEGQQLDMEFESRSDVKVQEYIEMIRLKTSVLLGCACRCGALMAGADEPTQRALYRFGELLGLAFQLQDDYLDTFGDAATFGKPIGGDIRNEKKTWLRNSALERDRSSALRDALVLSGQEKIDAVRRIYISLGLDKEIRTLITAYSSQAIEALPASLSPEAREFFTSLARNAETRDK